jgi:16S rRNA (adenine1518-N6/adenine1519-N6)-dimethyltransferase
MTARNGRIRPIRRLDQYFLIDQRYLLAEVQLANLSEKDTILEIGAGNGGLTKLISERAGTVHAVEKDPRFASHLVDLELGNVRVMCQDALTAEFPPFDKVMGNLPYSISTPLTFRLLSLGFELGVLAYQYEFARRMVCSPGAPEYSRLSVAVALMTRETELSFKVPRSAFRPVPEVDSAVVRLVPNPNHEMDEVSSQVIRMIFCHKRKTISNAIKDSDSELRNLYGINSQQVLEHVQTRWDRRVVAMAPEEVLAFAKSVGRMIGSSG